MRLVEFDQMPKGLYDPTQDKLNRADIMSTRKKQLSLRDINRLKKIRAFHKLEDMKRQDLISIIYSQPNGDDDGGGGF